jgi:hypothetical protein
VSRAFSKSRVNAGFKIGVANRCGPAEADGQIAHLWEQEGSKVDPAVCHGYLFSNTLTLGQDDRLGIQQETDNSARNKCGTGESLLGRKDRAMGLGEIQALIKTLEGSFIPEVLEEHAFFGCSRVTSG